MCIVQCYSLQDSSTRSLGDESNEFGNKSMCILESLATIQHGACFLIDLESLQTIFKLVWTLSVVRQGNIAVEWQLNIQVSIATIVD